MKKTFNETFNDFFRTLRARGGLKPVGGV